MATHDQSELGPVFDSLQSDGYITFGWDENSYGIAAEFATRARAAGVVLHTDEACPTCQADDEADVSRSR